MLNKIPKLPLVPFNLWFHAVSPVAKSRGVTIALRKGCPLIPIQTDPEERYIFIKGMLHGCCYTLAAIYAPNVGTVDFIEKTLKRLDMFKEGFVIVGGDFNIILDLKLDTTAGKPALSFRALRHVKTFQSLHIVDSWRALNAETRDYSYYSKTHKVYSRLDLFLVDHYYIENVKTVRVEQITISDHAPVMLIFLPVKVG